MAKKRTTNAGEVWDVTIKSQNPGRAQITVETEKHIIRFDLEWHNIRCLADHLWDYMDQEQVELDRVKTDLRGNR